MKKTLNVTVERGFLIDVSSLSDDQIDALESQLYNNEISPENIAQTYGVDIKDTAYEAQATLEK